MRVIEDGSQAEERQWLERARLGQITLASIILGLVVGVVAHCGGTITFLVDFATVVAAACLGREDFRRVLIRDLALKQLVYLSVASVLIGVALVALPALFADVQAARGVARGNLLTAFYCGSNTITLFGMVLTVVILGPIAETIRFNGWIQTVAGWHLGDVAAFFVGGLSFGLVHGFADPTPWLLGFVFAFLRWRFRALLPIAVTHILLNLPFAVYLVWVQATSS